MMIIEVDSASQVPHVTEPLMLNFDASVHYRAAMAPAELSLPDWRGTPRAESLSRQLAGLVGRSVPCTFR